MRTNALKSLRLYESLRRTRPANKKDLKNYVKVFLRLDIPDKRICPEHNSPLDYLWHSFSADFAHRTESPQLYVGGYQESGIKNADCIVWANRAGGKTELAAVATLLDCVFKPNCQVRILAGSGDQASKMYEYFVNFLGRGYDKFLTEPARKDRCHFTNNCDVEVLTQSATSIRGQHIQKLRCDEVELFEEDVFNAAKFTTQSKHNLTAAMEVISTMHRPYGLMQKLVADAARYDVPIFKWCVWETIEKCTDRSCSQCPLWQDCQAKARHANGYLKIDDVITQMRRASRAGFEAEMLCLRPSLENAVFAEFDPAVHVKPIDYEPNLPLYRSLDFGFINPFVCLWLQADNTGTIRVIDEYIRCRATIDTHAQEIIARTPCPEVNVAATFCDPAGAGVNDVTGTSAVRELKARNIRVRYRRSSILEGVELIRRAIKSGDGQSKLVVSPRCSKLVEALRCYHYPESGAPDELPLKDGLYDHSIDALRYFFVNYRWSKSAISRYY
jgi:hypothetical protein